MDAISLIKPCVIIGVHVIPLPWDYSLGWENYYFNERFIIAAYLVGAGDTLEYIFPALYINEANKAMRKAMDPIWQLPALTEKMGELGSDGAFGFTKKA